MRERLDCLVLAPGRSQWAAELQGSDRAGRLRLHVPPGAAAQDHGSLLSDAGLSMGRYDACLLYVDSDTLVAWRTALAGVRRPPPQLIAHADGLRAQAIRDLYALGVADFVRPPFCADELRARIEHLLDRSPAPAWGLAQGTAGYGPPGDTTQDPGEAELCSTILARSGSELEAYAVAAASRHASSRVSFREAKGRIIARFERAYIHASLGRHRGNITLAARAAQKHRRAFWALMRKHEIDPQPYRQGVFPLGGPDG